MKVQGLLEKRIFLLTRTLDYKKPNLFHTCTAKKLSNGNSLLWNVFVMRMNIQSRTKQNLPTSLTLKTKIPLAKCFKAVHHPQLAWDPGSNKVQELLPSRTENEIPNRCGPGVKKQKVNTLHPSLDSTSVKTEINTNSNHCLVWRWAEFPPVATPEYHVVRTAAELLYC